MIDEKKIEKAAKTSLNDCLHKKKMEHEIVILGRGDYIEAFKAGINWFLENLAHPMNESPKMGDLVLIIYDMEQYELKHGNRNVSIGFTHELDFHDNWERFYAKNPECKYWISVDEIDDLLKGGK